MIRSVSASRSRSPVVARTSRHKLGAGSSSPSELRKLAVDPAVEANDAARPGIDNEPHLPALSRLEAHRGAGWDVEAIAARLLAIESKRRVGLIEVIMRADLYRAVARIRNR